MINTRIITRSIFLILIVFSFESCDNSGGHIYLYNKGGLSKIEIDTKTSLKKQLQKLETPWDFRKPLKWSWIGYTDDMYSIAYQGEKAIQPLMNLIKKSDSLNTKIAAIYTLHLIGNYDAIVNKGYEEFTDTLARKALISLISDPNLHKTAVSLLKRFPWAYDLPYLMDYLGDSNSDYSYVLSALRVYQMKFEFLPLWQELPNDLIKKELTIYTDNQKYNTPNQVIYDMIALKNALKGSMVIDKEIIKSKVWKDGLEFYKNSKNEILIPTKDLDGNTIKTNRPTVYSIDSFDYSTYIDLAGDYPDNRFIYAFKYKQFFNTPTSQPRNDLDTLYIYTPVHARKILLDWWSKMTEEEKQHLARRKLKY